MEIALKTAACFFLLLFFTRILGKKQMSQITYFNYVTGITYGSIAASVCVDDSIPLFNGVVSLAVWSLLTVAIGLLALFSRPARLFFDGQPDILIRNGKIEQRMLRKNRLNINDITMLLREKDIFSIQDVEYAILEPHGKLSVLKKPALDSATRRDLQIPAVPPAHLPVDLILDGRIVQKNLTALQKDGRWLTEELKKYGLSLEDVHRIFYLVLQQDESTYLCLKEEQDPSRRKSL